jgi:hypothetical protein
VFLVALVCLAWISFLFICYSQVLCKQGKRHQLCGSSCGVQVTREKYEESSLNLGDRLREGKG